MYRLLTTLFLLLCLTYTGEAQLSVDFSLNKSGGCSPLLVQYNALIYGTARDASFQWDLGNGNTATGVNPQAIYTSIGTYTVTLTVTAGGQSYTASHPVTVYAPPTAAFSSSASLVCSTPVTFTSSSQAGDGYLAGYLWDFGEGTTQQGSSIQTHSFVSEGSMTVSLTVTDNHGCTASATQPNLVQVLPKLNPVFGSDKQVLCNVTDAVQFTNTSNGPGTLSYNWDFADGTTSTQTSPSHSYTQKGNYDVKLTVTSSVGCVASTTQPTPLNVANYSTDFTVPTGGICQGDNLSFPDLSQPTANSRAWSIDGNPMAYYDPFSYTFFATGTHTVTLANVFGACPQQMSKQVTVNALPSAVPFDVTVPGTCGAPVTVNFTDHSTGGVVNWDWKFFYSFGGPQSEYISTAGPTASHLFTENNAYNIQLTVTNAAGCKASVAQNLTLSAPSVTIYEVPPGSQSRVCLVPVTKTLAWIQPAIPVVSWSWDFGDGTSSTDANPTHTWTAPGQYSAVLHWTDANGCTGTSANSILVIISPGMNLDFETAQTTVCAGTNVVFTSASLQAANPTNINWDFGDGGSNFQPNHVYTTPGVYTVTLSASNTGGCTATKTKTQYITVLGAPGNYNGYTNTCDANRNVVTFNYTQSGTTSISWDFGDGTYITTPGNVGAQQHTYARTGTYYINVAGTNGVCSNQKSDAVFVLTKQNPILSATSSKLCNGSPMVVSLQMERNPREVNTGYYYDYTPQFFYGDGTPFNGSWNLTDPNNGYVNGAFQYVLTGYDITKSGLYVSTSSFGFGCTDISNTIPMTVQGSASAGLTVTSDNQCFKNAVTLQDASTVGPNNSITSWTWDFGDGQTQASSSGGSVHHLYAHPGNYLAHLTIQDQGGCGSTSGSQVSVRVNGPEPGFFYSPGRVLMGNTVYFSNTTNSYGASGTTYHWDFGDGTSSTDASPSHLYSVPGTYTVTLTATGGTGNTCTLSASQTIVVNYFNSHFQIAPSYVTNGGCPPVLAQFSNTSVNYSSVAWDFGDGTVAGNINYPSHVYTAPGRYQVTLSVYGSGGLIAKYTDSVFVLRASANVAARAPAVCVNQPEQLQAKAKGALNFAFDYGDGTVSNGLDSGVTHTYVKSGDYTVRLLVTDTAGCPATADDEVRIAVNPLPTVAISPGNPFVCLGSGVVLTASGGSIYSWTPVTALDDPGSGSPVASPTVNTTYTVGVTDDNGCQAQKSVSLRVRVPETIRVSPDSTGICAGDTLRLTAKGTDVYQWIGDVGGLSSVSSPDVLAVPPQLPPAESAQTVHFQVVGSDADACFSDTAQIAVTVRPVPTVAGGGNVEVLAGEPIQLMGLGSSDVVNWEWTPAVYLSCTDCAQPVCTPKKPELYTVAVTNDMGCHAHDTVRVNLLCVESHVRIPEGFSPNGDGHNDRFSILGIGLVDHLTIYDRWGVKVFERDHFYTADLENQWDGNFHGQPSATGVYVYFVQMSCPSGGVFTRKGTLVLVR
jgi:gliding motility-associated-like protein